MEQLNVLLEFPFLETRQLVCPESMSCMRIICLPCGHEETCKTKQATSVWEHKLNKCVIYSVLTALPTTCLFKETCSHFIQKAVSPNQVVNFRIIASCVVYLCMCCLPII